MSDAGSASPDPAAGTARQRVVCLPADAGRGGAALGERVAPGLRRLIAREGREAGADQRERRRLFLALLERVAPHWIDWSRALSGAAGIRWEDLVDLNCLQHTPWRPADEAGAGCTSGLSVVEDRGRKSLVVWKNRDERPRPQVAYAVQGNGERLSLVGVDIAHLGYAHTHSARGLAIASNTGGFFDEQAPRVGLHGCHLQRLMAEHAADCDQALGILDNLLGMGAVGESSFHRGVIFLMADAGGQGAVVELSCSRMAHRWVRDGVALRTNHYRLEEMQGLTTEDWRADERGRSTLLRLARAAELLDRPNGPPPQVPDFMAAARDRRSLPHAICNDGGIFPWRTVSAFIHVAGGDWRTAHTWICNGHPLATPFVPVFLAGGGVPGDIFLNEPVADPASVARDFREAEAVCRERVESVLRASLSHEAAGPRASAWHGHPARVGPGHETQAGSLCHRGRRRSHDLRTELDELSLQCVDTVRRAG